MSSKKMISCICAAALLLAPAAPINYCTFSANANSIESFLSTDSGTHVCGNFEYQLTVKGEAVITKYTGVDSEVTVPSTLDGNNVTVIGSVKMNDKLVGSFAENQKIEKVILPNTVTEIESVAFLECTNLKSIVLPDSLQKIGGGAFVGTQIENIEFPSSLDTIPDHCFTGCPFTKIDSTNNIKKIEGNAFWQCDKLTEVTFSTSLENIGPNAFDACTSLKDVFFLSNSTSIDAQAFSDREGNNIDVTIHGYPYSTAEAFANEYGFSFVVINNSPLPPPENVITEGDFDFIEFDDVLILIGYNGTDKEVEVPSEAEGKKVLSIGQESFKGNNCVEKVILPNTIIYIGTQAFCDCNNLKTINLPDSVEDIGDGAFASTALESIVLPPKLEEIPNHGFTGCRFNNIIIPEGVKKICSSAFWKCENLTEITLPESLEEIGENAFDNCTSLKDATFKNPNTVIDTNAFSDRDGNRINVTIHGAKGSTADIFASKNGFNFEISTPQTEKIYGDVDNDGELTSCDSLMILRHSVNIEKLSPELIKTADVDSNDSITSSDALFVLRASVGLFDEDCLAGKAIID